MMDDVVKLLRGTRFRYSSEDDLQRGIETLLTSCGITFEREAVLTAASRIDFLLDGGIGIEVKMGGSVSELGYQVLRYLKHERVTSLIVVTTRSTHRDLPAELEGKKLVVVHLFDSAF